MSAPPPRPSPPTSGTAGIPITNFGRKELGSDPPNNQIIKSGTIGADYDNDSPTPTPSFKPRTNDINTLILNLKRNLGNTDRLSAQQINKIIESLKEDINRTTQGTDGAPNSKFSDIEGKNPSTSTSYINADINYASKVGDVTRDSTDTETGIANLYVEADKKEEIPCNQTNIPKIERKLQKCFDLEILYLRKHSELIKVFGFTLNLYDKFRKSTRLLLYLLKHLIYDTGLEGDTVVPPNSQADGDITDMIKIPRPVIQNIQGLIKDQKDMTTLMGNIEGIVNNADINRVLAQSPGT